MAKSFCNQCGQVKDMVTIPQALALSEVSRSTLYSWMKKGWLHWTEVPSGRRLICRDSLFQTPGAATDMLVGSSFDHHKAS